MKEPTIKTGDKYNRLTAVKFHHWDKRHKPCWLFECDCGEKKVICVGSVKNGHTKACGCLRTKHGMRKTRTYKLWKGIKQRCLNPNNPDYRYYGGRGITICPEWLNSFINFYADMGDCPDEMTLDRIKNNENYCKSNCRYATRKEQANNTRQNRLITYKNKTQTIAQWSEELEINYNTLYSRIKNGNSLIKNNA